MLAHTPPSATDSYAFMPSWPGTYDYLATENAFAWALASLAEVEQVAPAPMVALTGSNSRQTYARAALDLAS